MVPAGRHFRTIPVFAQFVTFSGVHGGHEFEGIQRLTAGVDLFEHDAHGLLTGCLAQRDDGHMVFCELIDNLFLESSYDLPFFAEVADLHRMFDEFLLPIVPIENPGNRIHEVLELRFAAGEIAIHIAIECTPDHSVFRNGYDSFLAGGVVLQGCANIDVEPATYLLVFWRDRLDDLIPDRHLI